ncbi:hypothetical protein [Aestuariispira ectoiniformans]|uniref:hypothetical protein n=1 Tax=Aestuariispira ectoiniformans TaxID=2775080 RepID=UPI00223A727D|nr:hypothetical protein [Aestuariispira ectoiniformans]
MTKDKWTSWREQPALEVLLIWISVLLAFAIAAWQLGPALTGAGLSLEADRSMMADVRGKADR